MPSQSAADEYEIKLPFGPPPVLPDVEKQLKEYLLCPERLPIHNYKSAQKFWPRKPNPASLYHYEAAPLGTTLKVIRDPTTGELLQFKEVMLEDLGCTAKNSMSLRRAPGSQDEVRGNHDNFPFWPGGFPELSLQTEDTELNEEVDFEKNLLTTPPGFEEGILFKADGKTPRTKEDKEPEQTEEVEEPAEERALKKETEVVSNLISIVKQEEDLLGLWKNETISHKDKESKSKTEITIENLEVEAEVVPKEDTIPVLKISETPTIREPTKAEWAQVLNVSIPVVDFEKKIPNMAKTWDFTLDTFQKQAILKLEERSHVFVAAHTSAGKTVVAEYAIALSQKHMTKAIYTSPIKALSNQKYRDFKDTFEDVGLITGDFQINQTAQCLIMTTEILRRMLYCGSEVVRDLEYVIFDEVHYINDSERGHVWEEVLILLPPHVIIVMLSATVPNTLEFADWVGRTKQKKVYVISTKKRPVPLKHFLYIGISNETKDDCFLILDQDSWKEDGFYRAEASMKAIESKNKKVMQVKAKLTPRQEKTMWIRMIEYLQKNEKLPVVAFTLSRNRCDQNSMHLVSIDLTTKEEKAIISTFFNKCIRTLKPPDQELPQVKKLKNILQRGIGVHHSGILPILKEIVEMLFQRGLVKLLFATETFAMGVNMPARTVVFDAIKKFDGTKMRPLLPAEYIQMAGRAGRRGLDETGTVIILCKAEIPPMSELKNMMLGKPTMLESKFRITYSMILNLCRVETITVENMMSHSFKQYAQLGPNKEKFQKLKTTEEKLKSNLKCLPKTQGLQWSEMCNFYDTAVKYIRLWTDSRQITLGASKNDLIGGRVLLISHKEHIRKLGLLLSTDTSRSGPIYKVLVLCNSEITNSADEEIKLSIAEEKKKPVKDERDPLWYKIMTFARKDLFVPDGIGGHTVLNITVTDIINVTRRTLNVDCKLVYNDWDKRQIPRFRDCPPSQTCTMAVQMLTELTHSLMSGSEDLNFIPSKTIVVGENNFELLSKIEQMSALKKKLEEFTCVNLPNFEQLFESVFTEKHLEEIRAEATRLVSFQSLEQYDEFQRRIAVLQELEYIDSTNKLELKGRVAYGMGNNELLITEMILENIFTERQPAEIAALLSCLVFQQRTNSKQELAESLEQGKKSIENIIDRIQMTEKNNDIKQEESNDEFAKINFGLVKVVYEWARGQKFSSIMKMTDVQEGVIVRCIQQLNETIRDVKNAANVIGNSVLKQKMQEASDAIKRDIVFAASLYTSEETRNLKARFQELAEARELAPQGDE